jgi:hypothetical protein
MKSFGELNFKSGLALGAFLGLAIGAALAHFVL